MDGLVGWPLLVGSTRTTWWSDGLSGWPKRVVDWLATGWAGGQRGSWLGCRMLCHHVDAFGWASSIQELVAPDRPVDGGGSDWFFLLLFFFFFFGLWI